MIVEVQQLPLDFSSRVIFSRQNVFKMAYIYSQQIEQISVLGNFGLASLQTKLVQNHSLGPKTILDLLATCKNKQIVTKYKLSLFFNLCEEQPQNREQSVPMWSVIQIRNSRSLKTPLQQASWKRELKITKKSHLYYSNQGTRKLHSTQKFPWLLPAL